MIIAPRAIKRISITLTIIAGPATQKGTRKPIVQIAKGRKDNNSRKGIIIQIIDVLDVIKRDIQPRIVLTDSATSKNLEIKSCNLQ